MLMNRNGDAEKCLKLYKRIIKLLTVSWQKGTNSWRKMVSLKVSPFAVIRGHRNATALMSKVLQSHQSGWSCWLSHYRRLYPLHARNCIWCLCLRACVYFPTAQRMQSAHVDLLWHVYSRANVTFVSTMKAHHMRLKQMFSSGSSALMKLSFQTGWCRMYMSYVVTLVGAKLTSFCHIWTSVFLAVCIIAGGK